MINVDKFVYNDEDVLEFIVEKHGTGDQTAHGNWARGRISQTQARDIASQAIAGGFSFNPASKSSPKSGFMIARTGATTMVGDANNLEETARALKNHLDQNVDKYLREPNLYIGGWVKDGKLWIEPSDNWSNKTQAVRLGKMRDQIAIWDVVNFQEIQTGGTGGERAESGSNRAPSEIFKSVSNAKGMEFDDRGTEDGLVEGNDSVHHKESVVKHLPGQHDQAEHAGARAATPNAQLKNPDGTPQTGKPDKKTENYNKPRTSAGSIKDRVKALAEKGRRILVKPSEVREAMDEFAKRNDNPDLTSMHVDGTNLYDEDNLGIPRNKMPQVPSDKKGVFISLMEKRGVKIQRADVDPNSLHPIQAEISATKSAQIMKRLRENGTKTDDTGRIVVSKDNYVIDGHHRWAATSMLKFENPSIKIPVIKVDMNHQELIDATVAWNGAIGIEPLGMGESNPKSTFKKWKEFDEIVAKAVRGRTVIRFQPGLKPVIKHGDHDQSSHGNWATGSSPKGGSAKTPKNVDANKSAGTYTNEDGESISLWDNLSWNKSEDNPRLEQLCGLAFENINRGEKMMSVKECLNYTDEVLAKYGYGDRLVAKSVDAPEVFGGARSGVEAAISRGMTELLPDGDSLKGKDIPVLCLRKRGTTKPALLHEIAHIMEGSWISKSPEARGGHNEVWYETWHTLLQKEGLNQASSYLSFMVYKPEGTGVLNVD